MNKILVVKLAAAAMVVALAGCTVPEIAAITGRHCFFHRVINTVEALRLDSVNAACLSDVFCIGGFFVAVVENNKLKNQ